MWFGPTYRLRLSIGSNKECTISSGVAGVLVEQLLFSVEDADFELVLWVVGSHGIAWFILLVLFHVDTTPAWCEGSWRDAFVVIVVVGIFGAGWWIREGTSLLLIKSFLQNLTLVSQMSLFISVSSSSSPGMGVLEGGYEPLQGKRSSVH